MMKRDESFMPRFREVRRRNHTFTVYEGMERELDLILHELFDTRPYTRHGVQLSDGMCVVDLGANMGLFSVWCAQQARGLRIVACEPVPPLAELARRNVAGLASGHCDVLELGIGAASGEHVVGYYPQATACSTVHHEATERRMPALYSGAEITLRDLWSIHKGAFVAGVLTWPVHRWLRPLVVRQVLSRALAHRVDFTCRFTTLSEVIRTQQIPQIDLLKIDVQGSEVSVLDGISAEDWPRIRSIAMEVNAFLGPEPPPDLVRRLEARGFVAARDDSPDVAAPGSYFVFATRP